MVESSLRASGSILAAHFSHQQPSCSLPHGASSSMRMTTHHSLLMVETVAGAVVELREEDAMMQII